MRRMVLGAVGVALLALVGPPVAHASCAARPEPSPYRFVGTVVDVEADGRLAQVVRGDGGRVEVQGSPTLDDGAFTSVDRTYVVGGRYEFHPTNAHSPFQDNACTATRQLSGPTVAPPPFDDEHLPAWLPVDDQTGPAGYAVVIGVGATVVGALIAGLALASSVIVRRIRP